MSFRSDNWPASQTADADCRAEYERLRIEISRDGVDDIAVAMSTDRYTRVTETGLAVLRDAAYAPTGVALGAPFPSRDTELLRQVANDFAGYADQTLGTSPTFAFVPAELLHITVVNKSHFDVGSNIATLSIDEYLGIATVAATAEEPVTVVLHGLILTTGGRLIVSGYPTTDLVYRLRRNIVERYPQLAVNLPKTTHVKLGHLLVAPSRGDLRTLLDWTAAVDREFSVTAVFEDLYTPVGRIAIGSPGCH